MNWRNVQWERITSNRFRAVRLLLPLVVFALLLYGLLRTCHLGGIGVQEVPISEYGSPSGKQVAFILERDPKGFLVASTFIVRVEVAGTRARGPNAKRRVWQAYGTAPAWLEWAGEDSLWVIVPAKTHAYYGREKLREASIPGFLTVKTRVVALSDSEMSRIFARQRQFSTVR